MRNKEYWIKIILFFMILHLSMVFGAKLAELTNPPILCKTGSFATHYLHCAILRAF